MLIIKIYYAKYDIINERNTVFNLINENNIIALNGILIKKNLIVYSIPIENS